MTRKKSPAEIVVSPLTATNLANHIDEITEIYAGAVRETVATVELVPPDVATMSARISRNLAADYPAIVALDGSRRVVGYASCSAFRVAQAFRPTIEHSIYIDDRQHRCGVGRRILAALIEAAAARDFRQMIAVIESDQAGSLAFHKAMGFVEVGRLPALAYKHDRWCTIVFLQLALGTGNTSPPGRHSNL
jgi:L-amino acid N-acyltransferase YncA